MQAFNIKTLCDFDLPKTLLSGQIFHYKEYDNGKFAVAQGNKVCVVQQLGDNALVIECESEELTYWKNFFQVDFDARKFEAKLSDYLGVNVISAAGHGIRLLLQEPWEAFIQFLGASNRSVNNIYLSFSKIAKLSQVELSQDLYQLLGPAQLSRCILDYCGLGYRQPLFASTLRAITKDGGEPYLASLREKDLMEAMAVLQAYDGIGPKIASCIALYGLHFTQAFPVDVQIDRALTIVNRTPVGFQKAFKKDSGLAQLYLYQWVRNKKWQSIAKKS